MSRRSFSSVPIPATGDPTVWQTITAPVTKDDLALKGIKNLRLVFKTTAANQYNINWISIGKPLSTDIFKVAHFNPNQQSSTHITVNSRTNSTVSTLYNLLGQKTSIYNMTAAQHDKTHQFISPESDNHIVPGMYISK